MLKVTDQQYWMDGYLKSNLDSLIYNLRFDFDAVIPITGSGLVRVGKSMLAQQVGYYIATKLSTPFSMENIVFNSAELIKLAHKLPKNSVIIYDEAREGLDTKKMMESVTKILLDFFAECGMYNHVILVVLPDFFEIPKTIAIARSEFLINVMRTKGEAKDQEGNDVIKFERGLFEFYNRKGKTMLYTMGKKDFNNYDLGVKYRSFWGEFRNHWVIDKEMYELKKVEHLKRDRDKEKSDRFEDTYRKRFCVCLKIIKDTNPHFTLDKMVIKLKEYGVVIGKRQLERFLSEMKEQVPDLTSDAVAILSTPLEID